MYLLVFVTLVIALTGIYAEALVLQTKRLYANQTTTASAMLAWHMTAVAQAQNAGPINNGSSAAGCRLTNVVLLGVNPCTEVGPGAIYVYTSNPHLPGFPTCPPTTPGAPCWTNLPTGYNLGNYTFYSIYYQPVAGQQHYVITFVPPPTITATNPAPGFVVLPMTGAAGANLVGITMSDLFTQIKNSNLFPPSYGTVILMSNTDMLVTQPISNGFNQTNTTYTLPTAFNPGTSHPYDGSIAIISSF